MSDSTKSEINKRNELKLQSANNNDPEILRQYKTLRNRIKSKLKTEKMEYFKDKLIDKDVITKEVWKVSDEILGQSKDLSPKQLSHNGDLISSPKVMARIFNEIFVNKVKKINNDIPPNYLKKDPLVRLRQWLGKREMPPSEFELKNINKEVKRLVKKLKGSRSCGVDQIDSFSLKLASSYIEDVLLHLVNLSLIKYPEGWKTQLIHPLHKKADKTLGENYRPVSHMQFLNRL